MQFDIEKYVEALLPWDFSVTSGGVDYPVRPLTLGDVLIIEKANKEGVLAMQRLAEFVQSLFVGEQVPDVSKWPIECLVGVITELMRYWAERSKKNAERIKGPTGDDRGDSEKT